jgi:penicillin-binding protein 2
VRAETSAVRLSLLGLSVLVLFGALFTRLWFLQVAADPTLEARLAEVKTRRVILPATRGRILDRAGRILADNRPSLNVTVDREVYRRTADRAALFERLSPLLGATVDELEERWKDLNIDPLLPVPVAEGVDEPVAIWLKERAEDYPGVDVEEGFQRRYPYAPLASHVVGYLGKLTSEDYRDLRPKGYRLSDSMGKAGIERSFEEDLRGKPGWVEYEIDATGRPIRLVAQQDPVPGNDIQLTIDLRVQQYSEQILEAGLERRRLTKPCVKENRFDEECTIPKNLFRAPAGTTIVQDPRTGEIIAMASNPPFDNRWFTSSLPQKLFDAVFKARDPKDKEAIKNKYPALLNYAVQGTYQIGSTMKLFTSIAALKYLPLGSPGKVEGTPGFELDDEFTDTGRWLLPGCAPDEPGGCSRRNAGGTVYGDVTLEESMIVSVDTFYYELASRMYDETVKGTQPQQTVLASFGMANRPLGIDLPFEQEGLIPTAEIKKRLADSGAIPKSQGRDFFRGDAVNLAIGQGLVGVTPLQLVSGYSTFANGGTLYRPLIVKAILAPGLPKAASGLLDLSNLDGKVVRAYAPEVKGTVELPAEIREPLLRGLQGALFDRIEGGFQGTGLGAWETYPFRDAFPTAGKTGTAQTKFVALTAEERAAGMTEPDFSEYDRSLFVAFGGQDLANPEYTVATVMEEAGFGGQAAAPVTKCIFMKLAVESFRQTKPGMLGGFAEVTPTAGELDRRSLQAAILPRLQEDTACLDVRDITGSAD